MLDPSDDIEELNEVEATAIVVNSSLRSVNPEVLEDLVEDGVVLYVIVALEVILTGEVVWLGKPDETKDNSLQLNSFTKSEHPSLASIRSNTLKPT